MGARPARAVRRAGLLALAVGLTSACSCGGTPGGARQPRAAGPTRHHVTMHGVRFDPDSLAVAVGDTVEWDNRDLVPHTSTAEDGSWGSAAILPDSSWSAVIRQPGAHPYGCSYHPTMKGKLIARGG